MCIRDREYVYRLNMPREDFRRRMFLPGARREQSCAGASLVSMVSTLLLGLLIDPTGGFLPWSLALCALLLLDGLVFCRIPVLPPPLGRVIPFLLTLPAYLLLLPVGLGPVSYTHLDVYKRQLPFRLYPFRRRHLR